MLPIKCWKNITFIQFVSLLSHSVFLYLVRRCVPAIRTFFHKYHNRKAYFREKCSVRRERDESAKIYIYVSLISFAFHKYIESISIIYILISYVIIIHVIHGNRIFFVNIISSPLVFECVSFIMFSWFALMLTLIKANNKI